MKLIIYLGLFICLFITNGKNLIAQEAKDSFVNTDTTFNVELAQKFGADQYGMKHYVMAFLKSGPNQITDSATLAQIQMAHLKNIQQLAKEGKLVVAGPFLDNQPIRGIFILNVPTLEEARILTGTDPAIKAGVLEMELRPWYGSAALMGVVNLHKKIEKKSVTD